jgi:hypothetical protein
MALRGLRIKDFLRMPALHCPRCQRANPDAASFCYYDGAELKPHQDGAKTPVFQRLLREFIFPSGRKCQTFDELAQGCHEEWDSAKGLLRQGVFVQYFNANGRADLAKAAQEAQAHSDPDIALLRFVGALPTLRSQAPRLDLNPRRLLLGNINPSETRQVQLTISNHGQGLLQGTLKVSEGGQWLRIAGSSDGQYALHVSRDQQITLQVDTRGLPAAQTYGGKLTVITNGGVVEVPVRMDLVAQPFARAPFQGAKTPREMAERMRNQPKAAVPLLESGEISRWFTSNHWNYPVRGLLAKGVAGVQQFFEAMGLSKPPPVQISQSEVRFTCNYPERSRFQITLNTPARKWVYGQVESDKPWIKVQTPNVGGPQQAAIVFEIDPTLAQRGRAEGRLKIIANGGKTLTVRVVGDMRGGPRPPGSGLLKPLVTMAMACVLLRLAVVPVADFLAPGPAARTALSRISLPPGPDSPLVETGGWLELPWSKIFGGADGLLKLERISPGGGDVLVSEFRHYFVAYYARTFVLWLSWIGAAVGLIVMTRRRETLVDPVWGLVAGATLGVFISASVACVILLVEVPLHGLWDLVLGGGKSAGVGLLLLWVLLVLGYWMVLGFGLGLAAALLAPVRRTLLVPAQSLLAGLFRLCGLKRLASYTGPT